MNDEPPLDYADSDEYLRGYAEGYSDALVDRHDSLREAKIMAAWWIVGLLVVTAIAWAWTT